MPDILQARVHDLGGFTVRRLLPHARHRSVGPFVFFEARFNDLPGETEFILLPD